MAAGGADCIDHALGLATGNDLIVGPGEGPDRHVRQPRSPSRIATSRHGDERRPVRRIGRTQAPRSVTAHRPTGENAAMRVDRVFTLDLRQDGQRPLSIRRVGRPGLQDGDLLVFALREDDDVRKVVAAGLHEGPEADRRLQCAVGPALTRAVQVKNHGPANVGRIVLPEERGRTCARRRRRERHD